MHEGGKGTIHQLQTRIETKRNCEGNSKMYVSLVFSWLTDEWRGVHLTEENM